jgi:hypothetical protein
MRRFQREGAREHADRGVVLTRLLLAATPSPTRSGDQTRARYEMLCPNMGDDNAGKMAERASPMNQDARRYSSDHAGDEFMMTPPGTLHESVRQG